MGKLMKEKLEAECLKVWYSASKTFPCMGDEIPAKKKKINEKAMDEFLNNFLNSLNQFPDDKIQKQSWKRDTLQLIDKFIEITDIITNDEYKFLFSHNIQSVTNKFIKEVRSFDSKLTSEEIGQAIRNVWIINLIQVLFEDEVNYTPSIFAYSMLYPYTDNFLDNSCISKEEKFQINCRFKERLQGNPVAPQNDLEKSLFALVEKIEGQYSRDAYPQVYESLLYIHESQEQSLLQQLGATCPYENNIMGISVNKGGSSVVADGYLVHPEMTEIQTQFLFNYGVMLQFCDDLQDISEDYSNNHMTIFSQICTKWPLDRLNNALMNFVYKIGDEIINLQGKNSDIMNSIIRKNCLLLIMHSVIKNKKFFTKNYVIDILRYLPFTERYYLNLRNRLKKIYENLPSEINGISTEDIIFYLLE